MDDEVLVEYDDREAIEAHIDGPREEHEGHLHTLLRDIAEEGWPAGRKGIVEVMHQWRMKEVEHITFILRQAVMWHVYHDTGDAPTGAEVAQSVNRFGSCAFKGCEVARDHLDQLGFEAGAMTIPFDTEYVH